MNLPLHLLPIHTALPGFDEPEGPPSTSCSHSAPLRLERSKQGVLIRHKVVCQSCGQSWSCTAEAGQTAYELEPDQ